MSTAGPELKSETETLLNGRACISLPKREGEEFRAAITVR